MGNGSEAGQAEELRFAALGALYSAERAAELGDRKIFFDVLSVMLTVVAVTGVLEGRGELPWYLYAMLGMCVLGFIAYLTQLLAVVKVRTESLGILEEPLARVAVLDGSWGDVGSRAIQGVTNVGVAIVKRRNVLLFPLSLLMYSVGIVVAYVFVSVCIYKLWTVGGGVGVFWRCVSVAMGATMAMIAIYIILCTFVVVAAFLNWKVCKLFLWRQ